MSPRSYTPENDKNTLYINSNYISIGFEELQQCIENHFGAEINMADLSIEAEYIHTECLGYDLYDPSDYTRFLVIRKN